MEAGLAGQLDFPATGFYQRVSARLARRATREAIRHLDSAFRQDADMTIGEEFYLAHEPVTAASSSLPTGTLAYPI